MALVEKKRYVTVKFMDTALNITSRRYEMATTVVDPLAAAADIAAKVALLTDAEILGYTLSYAFEEELAITPAGNVNVEETLLISGTIVDQPTKKGVVNVPAPKPGNTTGIFLADIGSGANLMDNSKVAVQNFVALFQTGGGFRVSDGELIDNVWAGRRVHRRSGKSASYRIG